MTRCFVYSKDDRYELISEISEIKQGYSKKKSKIEYWGVYFEGKKQGTATNFEAAVKCLFILTGEKERIDIENDLIEKNKEVK